MTIKDSPCCSNLINYDMRCKLRIDCFFEGVHRCLYFYMGLAGQARLSEMGGSPCFNNRIGNYHSYIRSVFETVVNA